MENEFSSIDFAPPITEYHLNEIFQKDSQPNKVNLALGAYRTEEGKPWVLPVVRTVESQLASDESLDKESLPQTGLPDFCAAAVGLCFGEGHQVVLSQRASGVQTAGGTAAIRIGLDFLKSVLRRDTVLVSSPASDNYSDMAQLAGFSDIREYRYWDTEHCCLDEAGLLEDIGKAPEGSVVILQGVTHNPTGCDPSLEQWHKIVQILQGRGLFPFIDLACQGFATGDLDADATVPRMLANAGVEFFVSQSFSANFGLYNERVGNLAIVTKSAEITGRVKSQLSVIASRNWSEPPNHGARIVTTVLRNPALLAEWRDNVKKMADRTRLMRQRLYQRLRSLGTPGNWHHLVSQVGMFFSSGLTQQQVEHLRNEYSIYAMPDGRMNVAGMTSGSVDRVAQAIHDAVMQQQIEGS